VAGSLWIQAAGGCVREAGEISRRLRYTGGKGIATKVWAEAWQPVEKRVGQFFFTFFFRVTGEEDEGGEGEKGAVIGCESFFNCPLRND
jgi:hypothetical protein